MQKNGNNSVSINLILSKMKNKNFHQLGVVLTTKDYSIFKTIKGNRGIKEINVKRIMDSMNINYQFTIVIVNEFMEIIDGQHRIEACKRLKLHVHYIIQAGLRLKDVQRYNGVKMQWQKLDYAISYADAGLKPYQMILEFMRENPEFNLGSCENLLTNTFDGANEIAGRVANNDGKMTGRVKAFQTGLLDFTMEDKVNAYIMVAEIKRFKQFFRKYNSGVFVKTMISIFRNKKYDNDRMIAQLQKYPTMLQQCATVKQYKLLLQDIYNMGRRSDNRLALYL